MEFFIINDAIFSKLCILGDDVEPCFEGASVTSPNFNLDKNFSNTLFSMMKDLKYALEKGGPEMAKIENATPEEVKDTFVESTFEKKEEDKKEETSSEQEQEQKEEETTQEEEKKDSKKEYVAAKKEEDAADDKEDEAEDTSDDKEDDADDKEDEKKKYTAL
jgi:hypothetical protein